MMSLSYSFGHEGQVLAQVVQAAVPPGVVRLPDDVVVDAVLQALVEEPLGALLVAAVVDVDHDLRARGASPRPARRRGCRPSAGRRSCPNSAGSLPSGHIMPAMISLPICTMSGITPASRKAAIVSRRVLEHGLHQFVVRLAFPGLGKELLLRIGPGVGVVIVQQELVAELFGVFGQGDGVFQIVGQLRVGV